MRRQFRVNLTNDMSFWTLQYSSRRDRFMINPRAVVQNSRSVTYCGSKSTKSARILSALPSSPRLNRPIVWMEQHHVILLFSLPWIKDASSDVGPKENSRQGERDRPIKHLQY